MNGERLSSAIRGGDEHGAMTLMADAGGRRGSTEAKQTEALGVLSELLAAYRETPVRKETSIAWKLDGNFLRGEGRKAEGERGRFSSKLQMCGSTGKFTRWCVA